jgi:hypothetical protein
MRYLVRARIKPGREQALLKAIEDGSLGRGSVAGDEYFRNMGQARLCEDDTVRWVEICFCYTPLAEERPYWEKYFELTRIQDEHDRRKCLDRNGSEPWACEDCDCTVRLEHKLEGTGEPFLEALRRAVAESAAASAAVSEPTKDDTVRSSARPATRLHPSAA